VSRPQGAVDTAPPSAREMLRIAVGLTVVCLFASIILGGVYAWTEPAKARNTAAREQRLISQLLSLSESATVSEVRRYMLWRGNELEVFYLGDRQLVHLDAIGKMLDTSPVPDEVARSTAVTDKDAWVLQRAHAGEADRFRYAGRFFAGYEGDRNAGYVIEGAVPGFKTWIRFFLAVDAEFSLRGIEIIEHEEDPGLGAEITEPYFKYQYTGRSFDEILALDVTKDPLPNAWRDVVVTLADTDLDGWLERHRKELAAHPDIHAITGATISSVAVTDGVKRALRNFRKRLDLVEEHL